MTKAGKRARNSHCWEFLPFLDYKVQLCLLHMYNMCCTYANPYWAVESKERGKEKSIKCVCSGTGCAPADDITSELRVP